MISLLLDTSNFRLIVAVVDESKNEILSLYNEKLSGDLSIKVFEVIKTCIDNANILPKDIDKIYSVVGPGSFTGVRIGVTIAKTFAWSIKKNVIPLSSLEVLASTESTEDMIVSAIDARREHVYAGIYDKNLNIIKKDSYILLEDLKKYVKQNKFIFVSDDEISFFENKLSSNIDILKVINKHKNDTPVNPHSLNPVYLKITEAEANKNKLND